MTRDGKQPVLLSARPRVRFIATGRQAYFDAAAVNRQNEKHWAVTSDMDINSLIRQDLATIRKRAYYEILNNSYGAGIVDTLAFDIVGESLRPQIDSGNPEFDEEAEEMFCRWMSVCDYAEQTDFLEMLQMDIHQQCCAGESLTTFKRDERVGPYEVGLRLLSIETERLDNPMTFGFISEKMHDGIEFDDAGRPQNYYICKTHPNSGTGFANLEYDTVPASQIIHLFRIKRPGQHRGIPWLTPALPLFADLRRFTLATIAAAETAADLAGILKNTTSQDPADSEDIQSNDVIELERRALLTVPMGWDMQQMKSEHPATTYKMFKAEIVNEIARCVLMPYGSAAGNSSEYNYASGRLDKQTYHKAGQVIRHWIEVKKLRRIFIAWMTEAWLLPGYFTTRPSFEEALAAIRSLAWFWPGHKHVDPVKEAQAERIRLESGSITLNDIYSEQGADWRKKVIQRGKEIAFCKEHGVSVPVPQTMKLEEEKKDEEQTEESKTNTPKE